MQANAGSYADKSLFYEFKKRFLKRFGDEDGWDSQTIQRECWTCDGSGEYAPGVECRKCSGSGTYDQSHYWLRRYKLTDGLVELVFHIPESPIWPERPKAVEFLTGRVQHAPIPEGVARRCFLRLLLRYEPATFYRWVMELAKYRIVTRPRFKLYFCLIRLRNKLDLFPANQDETPF
jgi:hypothetical protein